MQKNDRMTTARTGFGIADIQNPGIDLLQSAERLVRPRLDLAAGLPVLFCRIVRRQNRTLPNSAAATLMAAMAKKRRRLYLISSAIYFSPIGLSS